MNRRDATCNLLFHVVAFHMTVVLEHDGLRFRCLAFRNKPPCRENSRRSISQHVSQMYRLDSQGDSGRKTKMIKMAPIIPHYWRRQM